MQTQAFNEKAYAVFLEMAKDAKDGQKAREAAKEKLSGAYNTGVKAAALCANLDEFLETIGVLEDNVCHNRGGLAIKFGAEKREKPDEENGSYKVPPSIMTVKTQVKFAFENGIAITDEKGNPLSFGQIRKVNAMRREELRKEKQAKAEAKAVAELTGRDKLVYEARLALQGIAELLPTLPDNQLEQFVNLHATIAEHAKAEAEKAAKTEAKSAKAEAKGKGKGKAETSGDALAAAAKKAA